MTINKELGTFRTMLNMAVRDGIIDKNPLESVKWLKEDSQFHRFRTGEEIEKLMRSGNYTEKEIKELRRFRYLTFQEIKELLSLAEGMDIHHLLATAAYTGMRLSELLRLQWSDVNWDSSQIIARGTKGSSTMKEVPRHIPLHRELASILSEHRENHNHGRYVFGDSEGNSSNRYHYYWQIGKLTDGTEFEGVRFHCLRHSFASNLAARGVDQRLIDRFMGHQTKAMRQRYQHLFPDKKREAIEQLQF